MPQITDTMVLIGAINPRNPNHASASRYLNLVSRDTETFVPLVSIMEFDLVMKGRAYTANQRKEAFEWLAESIPENKIISNSIHSIQTAVDLQESGMRYFDSLITAIAIEEDAVVLTKDNEISKAAKSKW
ncbi:MAG: type II toxin-antitoxin system VapC family toxin [Nitrososphaerales archaeon]